MRRQAEQQAAPSCSQVLAVKLSARFSALAGTEAAADSARASASLGGVSRAASAHEGGAAAHTAARPRDMEEPDAANIFGQLSEEDMRIHDVFIDVQAVYAFHLAEWQVANTARGH